MPKLSGIIAPILTPFDGDGAVANDLWVSHAKWVLDQGAHFLLPFGTTGEALSLSLSERMAGLEALVEAGIGAPPFRNTAGARGFDFSLQLRRERKIHQIWQV